MHVASILLSLDGRQSFSAILAHNVTRQSSGETVVQAKKKYALLLSLLFCVVAATMGLTYYVKYPDQEQVEFITSFYKSYLSLPETKRAYYAVPPGAFYSKGAEALLATNDRLCQTLPRNDDICGYSADWDVFLSTQETDPKLTFATARFKAIVSGKNMVDVSFNVYPEYGADYDRKIRYVLVKENGGWRVDDVFFAEHDRFPVKESMRYQINEENQRVLQEASEISVAVSWVFIYLREADMLDRAERFVAFPLQVCSEAGNCHTLQKGDARLGQTILALHEVYFGGDPDNTTVPDDFSVKPGQGLAAQGKTVKVDALEFTYQGQAWWITKIDLSNLVRTIRVHPQHKSLN
jgi:hypothetical protein